ncbi:MAG: hypothetical protein EOM55_03005 [Clostridia bacterium]|nr:hypothetical protein [Clostridia bacterium]
MKKLLFEKKSNIEILKYYMNKRVDCDKDHIEKLKAVKTDITKNVIQKMILKSNIHKEHENDVKCYENISEKLRNVSNSKLIFYIGSQVVENETRDYYYSYDKERVVYVQRPLILGKEKNRLTIKNEIDVHTLFEQLDINKVRKKLKKYVDAMIEENDPQTWDELNELIIEDLLENKNILTEKESTSIKEENISNQNMTNLNEEESSENGTNEVTNQKEKIKTEKEETLEF